VSQETCLHKSPIPRAVRSVERLPVVAADVQPIGSNVRHGRGIDHPLTEDDRSTGTSGAIRGEIAGICTAVTVFEPVARRTLRGFRPSFATGEPLSYSDCSSTRRPQRNAARQTLLASAAGLAVLTVIAPAHAQGVTQLEGITIYSANRTPTDAPAL